MNQIPKSLIEAIESLRDAQAHYNRIKEQYKEEPILKEFYLYSAEVLIGYLQDHIKYLNEVELGIINYDTKVNEIPEVWIRLEGEGFKGKAPIGVLGNFLQKLNLANKVALKMIGKINDIEEEVKEALNKFSTFDLVTTASGSMKLGLKRTEYATDFQEEQLDLFYDEGFYDSVPINIDDFKHLPLDALKLMNKTIVATDKPEVLQELKDTYDEIELQKLFHHTKEILPSTRSEFYSLSLIFEDKEEDEISIATKETRRKMLEIEKSLLKEAQIIESKGLVRAIDLDKNELILRPFKFENHNLDEISCQITEGLIKEDKLESVVSINSIISFRGIIYFNSEEIPTKIKIEELW